MLLTGRGAAIEHPACALVANEGHQQRTEYHAAKIQTTPTAAAIVMTFNASTLADFRLGVEPVRQFAFRSALSTL
jgi:hypothetical protein